MEYTIKLIRSDPEMDKLFQKLVSKDKMLWKRFGDSKPILKWLQCFANKEEIRLALILADNIIYYTQDQVRQLWRRLLTNKVKLALWEEISQDSPPQAWENRYRDYLREKCVFVGFGNVEKSGAFMPYYLEHPRIYEQLKYMGLYELLNTQDDFNSTERVFLLDDFVGSGNQATKMWVKKMGQRSLSDFQQENNHIKFIYLALAGFEEGRQQIEKTTPMEVMIGEEYDDTFKCFSDNSLIYENHAYRTRAREVMRGKGLMLFPQHPLGYAGIQGAVAFHYNTPNNSLPVIWKRMEDGGWCPLFERFE